MHDTEVPRVTEISLHVCHLSVAVQKDLLKICIADPDYSTPHVSSPVANGTPETLANDATTAEAPRRLLATGSTESTCPDGERSLWGSELIHKVHVLVFVIAGTASLPAWANTQVGCVCSIVAATASRSEATLSGRNAMQCPAVWPCVRLCSREHTCCCSDAHPVCGAVDVPQHAGHAAVVPLRGKGEGW